MRSEALRCDWIAAISWQNFNRRGVASYGWAKKVVSWERTYSWWRCFEDCWNDNKRFRILHNFSDKVAAVFESIDSNFERSLTVDKMLSKNWQENAMLVFLCSWVNQYGKLHCCLILRSCHSHSNLLQTPPWSLSSHQLLDKTPTSQRIMTS